MDSLELCARNVSAATRETENALNSIKHAFLNDYTIRELIGAALTNLEDVQRRLKVEKESRA